MGLKTQNDVFKLTPPADKGEAVFFDEGKPSERAPGLGLRVRKAGSRNFVFFYRLNGKQQKYTIGNAESWKLEKARDEARTLRVMVDRGEDPATARPITAGPVVTLGDVVPKYLDARDPLKAKSENMRMSDRGFTEIKRYLNEYWKPLHNLPLGGITRADITGRLDEITEEKGAITSDRARTALSGLFAWKMEEDHTLSNPVMGSRRHGDNAPRERTLTDAELSTVWKACGGDDYSKIIKLLILTICRRDEIARLRWSEVSLSETIGESWIHLPATRTKNSVAHSVPLPEAAVAVLRGCPRVVGSPFVFARGAGGFSNFSKSKVEFDKKLEGVEPWTLHDLRRTGRTGLGRMGVPPHVAEACLNHLPAKLIRTYDRNPYASERREALGGWADHVTAISA